MIYFFLSDFFFWELFFMGFFTPQSNGLKKFKTQHYVYSTIYSQRSRILLFGLRIN